MQREKLLRILLVVGSVLIIVGLSLSGWMLVTREQRNVIHVLFDESNRETVHFEALGLIPGDEREYRVKLERGSVDRFDLFLEFTETGGSVLKEYARVRIVVQESVVYDDLLANAFEGERLSLAVDFNERKNTELRIVYYLPLDVGNEAKNTEAKFDLLLTASNE